VKRKPEWRKSKKGTEYEIISAEEAMVHIEKGKTASDNEYTARNTAGFLRKSSFSYRRNMSS
jgi:hypothetical protein